MRTLEFNIAENTKLYVRGGYATIAVLILSICMMVSSYWFGGWFFLSGLLLLAVICLINAFVIVEAGNTAYKETLGYVSNSVLTNGLHLVWPFVTKVVTKVTKQTEFNGIDSDINMPKGITVKVVYVVTYKLVERSIYRFAKEWIAAEQAFASTMRTATRAILPLYACDELVDDKNNAKTAALRESVRRDLEAKFLELLEENYYEDKDVIFEKISLSTMDIEFPDNYLAARQRIVDAEQSAIAAEAEKKAVETLAEAQAKATRTKGEAENAVIEQLGQILKDHPEINQKTFFEHYPQFVGGGVLPTFNVGSATSTPSSTPTTPTP